MDMFTGFGYRQPPAKFGLWALPKMDWNTCVLWMHLLWIKGVRFSSSFAGSIYSESNSICILRGTLFDLHYFPWFWWSLLWLQNEIFTFVLKNTCILIRKDISCVFWSSFNSVEAYTRSITSGYKYVQIVAWYQFCHSWRCLIVTKHII